MNIKGLTMFMAALKEGMHDGVNDAISLLQDSQDIPCVDEWTACEFTAYCMELSFAFD